MYSKENVLEVAGKPFIEIEIFPRLLADFDLTPKDNAHALMILVNNYSISMDIKEHHKQTFYEYMEKDIEVSAIFFETLYHLLTKNKLGFRGEIRQAMIKYMVDKNVQPETIHPKNSPNPLFHKFSSLAEMMQKTDVYSIYQECLLEREMDKKKESIPFKI